MECPTNISLFYIFQVSILDSDEETLNEFQSVSIYRGPFKFS